MGTAKRERQKANRRHNLERLARDARMRKTRKIGLRIGLLLVAVVILVAVVSIVGGDDNGSLTSTASSVPGDTTGSTGSTVAPGSTVASAKPTVAFPGADVPELKVTQLRPGSGTPAKAGDTISVNYVGVRSIDGVEFDNSYDRGQPFDLVLGAGSVIQGWEQGLVGVLAGGQYQIDIPADLAYGDGGSGEVIRPGDDITFVVDILSVTPGS